MRRLVAIACTTILFFATNVVAHSGNTNDAGCHNDYIHGGYHCHDGGISSLTTNASGIGCGDGLLIALMGLPLTLAITRFATRDRTRRR